jgi:hypothetical protein
MGLGPGATYLVEYNGYVLPGYVQQESFPSEQRIADHTAAYADGSNSEYTGLNNKTVSLTLKVWEQDYASCKDQVREAATMLRSKRNGFAPLYIQDADRYYDAMVEAIRVEKTAGTSVHMLEYVVDFQCKPFLVSETTNSFSGTGTIETTGRTISDGGWTYADFTVTGTNVTVSGYTANGDFAGYFSVSGAVTNLVIDSENYTAEVSGVNKNNLLRNVDYQMRVGPGVTYFAVTGASSCTVEYKNRWYL